MKYKTLAIRHPHDLVFGYAPNPVKTRRGLEFGAGTVYPELNFTLPPMQVSKANLPLLLEQYKGIANDALTRARELHTQGLVLEFEALLEMTMNPEIGVEIIKVMNDICEDYYQKYQIKSEIRLTPNDIREFERPPRATTSPLLETMFRVFRERCAGWR